ncbi:hypothetical protein [Xylophilus sp. GOD-11R]|uniref:hypothetical protein n=1 Tax=Xylophilus sp. GOD-11R TaxID=3089814 RepID=UPI00298C2E9E|nr:hypothetical protein [Xylophilus sp. GOD-11R]WPB55496.1 hypothetical protein R9X41_15250 [Xylophilus sp. GOD-11R]
MSESEGPTPPESSEENARRAAAEREWEAKRERKREQELQERQRRLDQQRHLDALEQHRRHSERRLRALTPFGWMGVVVIALLAVPPYFGEWKGWRTGPPTPQPPPPPTPQPDVQANAPPPPPPPFLVVDVPRAGDPSGQRAERGGLPSIPPEVITSLIGKLFDGGTAAVTTTGDLTRKFADAGIRITEDAARQILAALLRPGSQGQKSPPGAAPASAINSMQFNLSCAPERPTVIVKPPPPIPKPKPKPVCIAPAPEPAKP